MSEGEFKCRLYEVSDISSSSVSCEGSVCSIETEQLNNSDLFLSQININSFDRLKGGPSDHGTKILQKLLKEIILILPNPVNFHS